MRYVLACTCAAVVLFIAACAPAQQPTGAPSNYDSLRDAMVRRDIATGVFGRTPVRDEAVLRAMRTVPRHEFVPDDVRPYAYADSPLPIGHDQTISQPFIVATMTEALQVNEDDVVLEVGTGSGYQAAVLAEIVKQVYTIEIVAPLGRRAARDLKRLGYDNVDVRIGDGYQGWPEHAPFDAIIVTAAPDHVPQPLIDQLKPGGRMVIPVGRTGGVQRLKRITKNNDGAPNEETLDLVRFVPMTGEAEKKNRNER
jgi:protein-L-isoaspartate(D-aspartate) O-methyltransferase